MKPRSHRVGRSRLTADGGRPPCAPAAVSVRRSMCSMRYRTVTVTGENVSSTGLPSGPLATPVTEICVEPGAIVVAASAVGLCISRDAGATWTIESNGLHASYCSAVAFSGDDILVSASTDHFAAQGRIYRRPIRPDGDTVAVENGLPTWINGIADTGCIATNGATTVVVDRAGTLYLSTEFGLAWSRSSSELPTPSSVLIC